MFFVWNSGLPFNEVYCASKFAVEGACESLAILLLHFNIQWVLYVHNYICMSKENHFAY